MKLISPRFLMLALGCALALPATSARAGDGELFGTLSGAALGGLLGNQFGHGEGRMAYTGLGVFMGGLMGNSVGRSVDRSREYAEPSYAYQPAPAYYSATVYEPNYVAPPAPQIVYVQPQAERYVAYPTYDDDAAPVAYDDHVGRYCREFTQQVRIGNQVQESYGTACLQPDGSWQIQH